MTRTQRIDQILRRGRPSRESDRRAAHKARRRTFWLEPLEDRRLLASVASSVGAITFAASLYSTPGNLTYNGSIDTESVATDYLGNNYVTGNFNGTINLGGITLKARGQAEVYLAKLDPTGKVLWVQTFGSGYLNTSDYGRNVTVDSSGFVYVTGELAGPATIGTINVPNTGNTDVFLAKFDTFGNALWAESFGGQGIDEGEDVAVDNSGNVYLTGSYEQTISFGSNWTLQSAGGDDAFVTKLSSSQGQVIWAKSMGGPGDDEAFGVSVDNLGDVFTTGIFSLTATFGTFNYTSNGDTDIFVAKMNSNGTVLWARPYGGAGHDDGTSVVSDGKGGVYFTGDMVDNVAFGSIFLTNSSLYIPGSDTPDDAVVGHINGAGAVTWAHNFGGLGYDAGFDITTDASGNLWTTGVFEGIASFPWGVTTLTSIGGKGVYVVEMDSSGNTLAAQSFGSTSGAQAYRIFVGGPNHTITTAGDYYGAINLPGYYGLARPTGSGGYVVQFTTATPKATTSKAPSDFDGVGHTELAYYVPSNQQWWVRGPAGSRLMATWGLADGGGIPVAGDYLGLGRTQPALYDATTGNWWVMTPAGVVQSLGQFGNTSLHDVPAPGDYLGLGKTELAFYRPSTGAWYVQTSTGGTLSLGTFGNPRYQDIPVPGDYDHIGKTELAYYRPVTGQWYVLNPTTGAHFLIMFGQPNLLTGYADVPVPGDYDGVGYTQPAVYSTSSTATTTAGAYRVWRPSANFAMGAPFGAGYFYEVPTQASAGTLLNLGKLTGINSSSIRASSVAVSPGSGTGTVTGTGSASVIAPAKATLLPPAPAARNVVSRQGAAPTTTLRDLVASALNHLYGA